MIFVTMSASTLWNDASGGTTIYRVRTSTGVGPINTAIQAASDADWSVCWESAESLNTPSPTAAQYLPVKPDAVLYFLCGDGTLAALRIPSPAISGFLADQETIDASATHIATLITACVGNLASASGSLAVSFAGGRLNTTRT